jgi:hypothetical protein
MTAYFRSGTSNNDNLAGGRSGLFAIPVISALEPPEYPINLFCPRIYLENPD